MKPLGHNILVKQEILQGERNGIHLLPEAINKGLVVAVGEKVKDIEVGDTVLFSKFAYDPNCDIDLNGKKVLLMRDSSIEIFFKQITNER